MLNRLELEHFKCFELLRLPLSPLTLLAGSNASGKSTVLQALVLLHQTMYEREWSTRLLLNGAAIRMGTVFDVVDKVHGRHSLGIGLIDKEHSLHWTFSGERSDMSMAVQNVDVCGEISENPKALRYLLPPRKDRIVKSLTDRLRVLTYITAERVGPRDIYPLEDRQTAVVVGPEGEHAVSILYSGRDDHVLDELAVKGAPTTILHQTTERMRKFFPGCALTVQQVPQANAVTLGLRTSDDTDFHRPIHSGFGLTQTLPIVIAALSAKKGDILLIENPEVHLHPAGQALMGQFLAEIAQAEIQVIIETHSDHVLNGIRRSVKAQQLSPEQISIHFFTQRSTGSAQVHSLEMDDSGNIDTWPEGFFDQFDKDLNYFAGWGQ